jgi:hypothetical protein
MLQPNFERELVEEESCEQTHYSVGSQDWWPKNWRIEKTAESDTKHVMDAQPTATPCNGGKRKRSSDNDCMKSQTSSYSADSLSAANCHGHSFPCSSLAPCNNCHHFSWFWDPLYSPFSLRLGNELYWWSNFNLLIITGEFSVFFGH